MCFLERPYKINVLQLLDYAICKILGVLMVIQYFVTPFLHK